MSQFTFKKEERLKNKKILTSLFQKGQSFSVYPLRVVWLMIENNEDAFPLQVAISVPKRKFKKAVDRNRLKRQIKETYRLSKYNTIQGLKEQNVHLAMIIIYVGKEALPYNAIKKSMYRLLRLLIKNQKKLIAGDQPKQSIKSSIGGTNQSK